MHLVALHEKPLLLLPRLPLALFHLSLALPSGALPNKPSHHACTSDNNREGEGRDENKNKNPGKTGGGQQKEHTPNVHTHTYEHRAIRYAKPGYNNDNFSAVCPIHCSNS